MERRTGNSLQRLVTIGWLVVLYGAAMARADIHKDLQVRYRLDDAAMSSTATDSSTQTGRNGTLTNGATFAPTGGRINGAAQFAGDNDYISCPPIMATEAAQQLTVAFWVNPASLADFKIMTGKHEDANNLFSVHMGVTASGGNNDLNVAIHKDSTNGYVYTDSEVLSVGRWTHIAVVYNGSLSPDTERVKIYINGRQVQVTVGAAIPNTLHSNSNSDAWYLGWREDQEAGLAFDGKIDEFHLYTRALSASDIQELYFQTEGSILFNGNLFNGTAKLENTTADLLAGSNEITICAWLYPTGQGETSGVGGMVFALDEGVVPNIFLHHATSGENLTFVATFLPTSSSTTFPVAHNTWTPVAISYKYASGSAPTIRTNFQNVSSTQAGSGTPSTTNTGYCIGNFTGGTNTWAGRIAHLQFFNRALPAAEMDGCLNNPGSVKQSLRLWLPTPTAADLSDRSGNGFHGTGTALETANGPPYNTRWVFGATDETLGQIAIPSNGDEPATPVQGLGDRTKLTPLSTRASSPQKIMVFKAR